MQTSGGLEDVKRDVQDLGRTAESSGGGFNALQEIATGALRAIGTAAVDLAVKGLQAFAGAVQDGIADAQENAKIQAQTTQVLKSTGNAAGKTTEQIAAYASSLSDAAGQSLFGDDQIQQSTNLLLTFTNIKGASLDAATAISVDMAQAMGGAPKDAAIQLGKALNDPVKGITALSRVGVTFTDEQKAQIQAMQEAGDTAGAQAVILAELNKEFGGSAKAAADATGGWSEFNGRMGEAKEALGAAVLPLLSQLAGVLLDTVVPAVEAFAANFGPFIQGLQPAVAAVMGTLQEFATTIINAWSGASEATSSFGETIAYVLDTLIGTGEDIQGPFQTAFLTISSVINTQIIPAFNAVWTVLQTQVWPILQDLGTALLPLVGAAIQVLTGLWNDVLVPALRNVWTILTTVILPILASVAGWLKDNLPTAIQATADFFTNTLFPAIHTIYDFINIHVIPILQTVATWLITNVPVAIQKATDFFNTVLLPALTAIWKFIQDNIIPIIETLVNATFVVLGTAINTLANLWNTVLLPALDAIWKFISTYLGPILTSLTDVVIAGLKFEVNALAVLWNTVLLPAITAIWKFITEKLVPIFNDLINIHIAALKGAFQGLSDFWNDTFMPKMTDIYNFINDTFAPKMATFKVNVLDPMVTAWGDIRDAIGWVIEKLHELKDLWDSMKPPAWIVGESPPPLADWFSYVADSVRDVNAQLPEMQTKLMAAAGPGGSSIVNTASSRSFTYAPQISTTGNVSAPMDLALASSLAGV